MVKFYSSCCVCGREINDDEVGLYKKLINRGATEFMCIPCLTAKLGITEKQAYKTIEQCRESGCTLFAPKAT